MLITVVGLVVITQASSSAPLVIGAFAVWTIGGAPVEALGIGLILGATPPEKAGSASALPQVFNEMGSALGFALLGTVATVIYRVKLTGAVPAEVPPAAVAAAQGVAAQRPRRRRCPSSWVRRCWVRHAWRTTAACTSSP